MEWKIIEACPAYEISANGTVRRTDTGRIKAQVIGAAGYRVVNLWANNAGKVHYVHRLLMAAFVGPCPDGWQVNHKDGDRLNNSLANLEYLSISDNARDVWERGCGPSGARNGQARLTEDQAQEIRDRARNGERTSDLAAEFGVGLPIISQIKNGTRWRHLSAPANLT